MKRKSLLMRLLSLFIAILIALPLQVMAQEGGGGQKKLSREELAQLLAPIALYPDELVAQMLMASTYPIEVVQADRWAQQHKGLKGDALAKALEKESWDPSVKSLVNFPEVLSVMSQKLDLTTKVGDAFLSQQEDVMATIQDLRKKAQSAGNLKSTPEQKVVVEKETIVIQPANPEVVYVPSYSPTVVYGTWPYPAYPPYAYAPAYPLATFAAGVALGAAWGYAWGNCNWGGGSVNVNYNRNTNLNRNINRERVAARSQARGGNRWQHNPSHRKGAAYANGATARKYGQSPARSTAARREARGYGSGAGAGGAAGRAGAGTMDRGAAGRAGAGTMDRGAAGRPGAGTVDRGAASRPGGAGGAGGAASRPSAGTMDRGAGAGAGGRQSAFGGGSASAERAASDRGRASRQTASASRPSGGFGGGSSSFGGGSRGGGGFSGGGRGGGGGGRGGGRR